MVRLDGSDSGKRSDLIATEEPLEIRIGDDAVTVTMRTPGHDEELCAGWLVFEGLISSKMDLAGLGPTHDLSVNIVEAMLAPHVEWNPEHIKHHSYTSSACGVCGKTSLEAVEALVSPLSPGPVVSQALVSSLVDNLRHEQDAFARTGGLHAAGLFDLRGQPLVVREDVGRHNALDKVIGWALLEDRLPLNDTIICVSGRLSFELVHKAAVAGSPILVGISAPTSLAVELACNCRLTLCGFARNGHMNVYSATERIHP